MTATVDDAVRSHISWMTALSGLPGGVRWTDGGIDWAYDGPDRTLHALFPDDPGADAVRRGLRIARNRGAAHVAIWSAVDAERPDLVDIGFEVGWAPWWMGASTADVDETALRLAHRVVPSGAARPKEAARQPLLARDDVFRFEARSDGRYAGRAWGQVAGGAAGLYDMWVQPQYRRQGLGIELVTAVLAEAGRRGADRVTLNATPDGAKLYENCGFAHLGSGRTWWWHAAG